MLFFLKNFKMPIIAVQNNLKAIYLELYLLDYSMYKRINEIEVTFKLLSQSCPRCSWSGIQQGAQTGFACSAKSKE